MDPARLICSGEAGRFNAEITEEARRGTEGALRELRVPVQVLEAWVPARVG